MKIIKRILAGTMITTMLIGMTAFAEEATPAVETPQTPVYTCNIEEGDEMIFENASRFWANQITRQDYTSDPYYQYARSQIEANIAVGNKTFQVCVFDGKVANIEDACRKFDIFANLYVDILKAYPQYNPNVNGIPEDKFGSWFEKQNDWHAPADFNSYDAAYHEIFVLSFSSVPLTFDQYYSLPYFKNRVGELKSTSLYSEPINYILTCIN